MPTQLDSALDVAALNGMERRAIASIVAALEAELGEDLLAVWLYGSRARGEADPSETHYDRRSDVDMIAILHPRRDVAAFKRDFTSKLIAAVEAEGDSPPYYSLQIIDADWLVNRRRIRSFFYQEVDRDALVLYGERLADLGTDVEAEAARVRRSQELMEKARSWLAAARKIVELGHLSSAVSSAYFSMLYAARAALSEHDEYACRDGETWNLFHRRFVAGDAFDQHLHSLAQQAREARERADYEAKAPSDDDAKRYVEGAAGFLAAVEAMLDLPQQDGASNAIA